MSNLEPEAPLEGTPSEEDQVARSLEETVGAVATPERDPETGRFIPKDPRAQQVLDKYGGDLDKALSAAVDAQDLIGRQSNELGELRQYRDSQQQYQTPPEQIMAYAEHDPQQAVTMAYQQYGRGSIPYQQALRQWGDIDPFNASQFDNQVALADYDRQMRPQLAQMELSTGLQQVAARYPDFVEYSEAILREAQNSPIVAALREQGRPVSAEVIDSLYHIARSRANFVSHPAQQSDAEYSRQQKLSGGVASATAARPDEPPPLSEEDAFKAEYRRVAQSMGLMHADT